MKYYDGKTVMPDPYKGCSPMYLPDGTPNEALFVQLGGTITDDGMPTPEEQFFDALNDYLEELEKKAREELALQITVEEFKQAAATKLSDDLIAWAKGKGVPDKMIEDVRTNILTKVADASRLGLTWNDVFTKTSN